MPRAFPRGGLIGIPEGLKPSLPHHRTHHLCAWRFLETPTTNCYRGPGPEPVWRGASWPRILLMRRILRVIASRCRGRQAEGRRATSAEWRAPPAKRMPCPRRSRGYSVSGLDHLERELVMVATHQFHRRSVPTWFVPSAKRNGQQSGNRLASHGSRTSVARKTRQVTRCDAHLVDRRTLRAPQQQAQDVRGDLARRQLLKVGIGAGWQVNVAWRQPGRRGRIDDLERAMPGGQHSAVGRRLVLHAVVSRQGNGTQAGRGGVTSSAPGSTNQYVDTIESAPCPRPSSLHDPTPSSFR